MDFDVVGVFFDVVEVKGCRVVFPTVFTTQTALKLCPLFVPLFLALGRLIYVVLFVFLVVPFAVAFVRVDSFSNGPGSICNIFSIIRAGIVSVWA